MKDEPDCAVIFEGKRFGKFNTLERAQKLALECLQENPTRQVYVEQRVSGPAPMRRWDIDRNTGEWSCREASLSPPSPST
jgi:hypothetical protein